MKILDYNPLDPEVCGPDLFSELVPLEVHGSNSLYSEEKAKLLREVAARIDERDRQLRYDAL